MEAEVIGIDHLYVSARSMSSSERFYDDVLMTILGFRKNTFVLGGDPHVQYYNRHFGFVIRPARAGAPEHDSTSAGLHHLCLRVAESAEVDRVAHSRPKVSEQRRRATIPSTPRTTTPRSSRIPMAFVSK